MKKQIRLELGSLGIIDSEEKRALECYVDSRIFRQRKSFAEYYIDSSNETANINLNDLIILAETFVVRVLEDCVILSGK